MPPLRVDARHFSTDQRSFIELLHAHGVRYLIGLPPNRIDLINSIAAVDFEEAWAERVEAVMVGEDRQTPIPYIGVDALVKNKRAAARPKDLDDLSYLTRGR